MEKVYAGRCIVWQHDPAIQEHLWIVLSDPEGDPPQVVAVNLTQRGNQPDTTVVLNAGDHKFIKKETIVYYADARFVPAGAIEAYANQPGYRFKDDCSDDLLNKIREGLKNSKFTPKKIKSYCATRF